MSRVLITGGAGFIGSNLVEWLDKEGYSIAVLDRRTPSTAILDKVDFLRGDVRNMGQVMRGLRGAEAVVHLAGLTDVRSSASKFPLYSSVNVDGTSTVLLGCAKRSVHCFIMASSAAVYGRAGTYPTPETEPLEPLSPYAATKAAAEAYCQAFARQWGFRGVILRFFNVYGSRYRTARRDVVSRVVDALKSGRRPSISGSGNQTRDFIHVEDVAGVVGRALRKNASGVFNVGTGIETSVDQVVRIAQAACGRSDLKPVHTPRNEIEVRRSVADITKLKRVLGTSRLRTIEEGIALQAQGV